jgi:hypothetical protein
MGPLIIVQGLASEKGRKIQTYVHIFALFHGNINLQNTAMILLTQKKIAELGHLKK